MESTWASLGGGREKQIRGIGSIVFLRLAVRAVPLLLPNEGAERTFTFIRNKKKGPVLSSASEKYDKKMPEVGMKRWVSFFSFGKKNSTVKVLLCVLGVFRSVWVGLV